MRIDTDRAAGYNHVPLCAQRPFLAGLAFSSIERCAVSHDGCAAYAVAAALAGITGITLDSVYSGAIARLHDSHVIGRTVASPIEEDNVSGLWGVTAILPASSILEPLHARRTV